MLFVLAYVAKLYANMILALSVHYEIFGRASYGHCPPRCCFWCLYLRCVFVYVVVLIARVWLLLLSVFETTVYLQS